MWSSYKKAVIQMTAFFIFSVHLPAYAVGLGTFPGGGCRNVIGPYPSIALDEITYIIDVPYYNIVEINLSTIYFY